MSSNNFAKIIYLIFIRCYYFLLDCYSSVTFSPLGLKSFSVFCLSSKTHILFSTSPYHRNLHQYLFRSLYIAHLLSVLLLTPYQVLFKNHPELRPAFYCTLPKVCFGRYTEDPHLVGMTGEGIY